MEIHTNSPELSTNASQHEVASRLKLLVVWVLFVEACALIFWANVMQPDGVLHAWVGSYARRVWPLAVICVAASGFAVLSHRLRLGIIASPLLRHWSRGSTRSVCILLGAGLTATLVIVWALRAFPNSGDEYDYLFQAKTFLSGHLWNPVPPEHDFFAFYWQFFRDGKWTTYYPPGWPLILATVQWFWLPSWLACPLAGSVMLFATYKLAQQQNGTLGGILAITLILPSPFFLFNAASYFMHVPAAAAGVLFCYAATDFIKSALPSRAWLAGVALGVLGLVRPEDVLILIAPFAIEFLWRATKAHYRSGLLLIIGGLPFLIALLGYNYCVIGTAVPNLGSYVSPSAHFGLFGVNMFGVQRTPLDDLQFAASRLMMLAEWTSPVLVLGYLAAFFWGLAQRRLTFVDFIFPLFIIAYLFVPFWGGNQYGPRYYFEGYPFLVITTVSGIVGLLKNAPESPRLTFGTSMVMAHGAMSIVATVFLALILREVINERMDLYDLVHETRLHNAVVVVKSSTGRMFEMKPMDLTRNGITIDGNVIYALDIPGRLERLQGLFPQRHFYVYERDLNKVRGTLRPLN